MIERIEHDVWEGTGELVCSGEAPIPVRYRFDVEYEIAGGHGLPPALARLRAEGRIEALGGGANPTPEFDCQLLTVDRGPLRIRYVAGAWRILAGL